MANLALRPNLVLFTETDAHAAELAAERLHVLADPDADVDSPVANKAALQLPVPAVAPSPEQRPFLRLFAAQFANLVADNLVWNFVYFRAAEQSFDTVEMTLFFLVAPAVSIVALLLLGSPCVPPMRHGHGFLILGFVSRLCSLCCALFFDEGTHWLYASNVFMGVYGSTFWVAFNALYMRYSAAGARATSAGRYFLFVGVCGAILPLGGAQIIDHLGFDTALYATMVVQVLAIGLLVQTVRRGYSLPLLYDLRAIWPVARRHSLWLLPWLEGVHQGVFGVMLQIGSLRAAGGSTETFGYFLAFLSAFSGLATWLVARWSDRAHHKAAAAAAAAQGANALALEGAGETDKKEQVHEEGGAPATATTAQAKTGTATATNQGDAAAAAHAEQLARRSRPLVLSAVLMSAGLVGAYAAGVHAPGDFLPWAAAVSFINFGGMMLGASTWTLLTERCTAGQALDFADTMLFREFVFVAARVVAALLVLGALVWFKESDQTYADVDAPYYTFIIDAVCILLLALASIRELRRTPSVSRHGSPSVKPLKGNKQTSLSLEDPEGKPLLRI